MTQQHTVVLIPGDGIGPEVSEAVTRLFTAVEAPIQFEQHHAGITALAESGEVLPATTTEAIRTHRVALKGPCTTPVGKGFTSVNVALRKQLDLYAAVRPIRSLNGVPTRFPSLPAQRVFDDNKTWWYASDGHSPESHGRYQVGWSGVDVPKTGTTIRVRNTADHGFYMFIDIGPSK